MSIIAAFGVFVKSFFFLLCVPSHVFAHAAQAGTQFSAVSRKKLLPNGVCCARMLLIYLEKARTELSCLNKGRVQRGRSMLEAASRLGYRAFSRELPSERRTPIRTRRPLPPLPGKKQRRFFCEQRVVPRKHGLSSPIRAKGLFF